MNREILSYTDAQVEAFFKLYLAQDYNATEARDLAAKLLTAAQAIQQYPWILANAEYRNNAQNIIRAADEARVRVHDCTLTPKGREAKAAGK